MEKKNQSKKIIILVIIVVLLVILGSIIFRKNVSDSETVAKKEYYDAEYNSEYINVNTIEIENLDINNEYQFVFIADLQASILDENEEDEQIRVSLENRRNHFLSLNANGTTPELIFSEIINTIYNS